MAEGHDIFYDDVQFGQAIHTMTEAAAALTDVGNVMRGATGGELGPPKLETAAAAAADRWLAGSVRLAAEAKGIATNISAEIAQYQTDDLRAQKTFAEIISGTPFDGHDVPSLPRWDREPQGPEDADRWRREREADK